MPYLKSITALCLLLPGFFLKPAVNAQNSCPANLDFETGSFANWQCKTGYVTLASGQNSVNLSPAAPTPGRHELIPFTNTSNDHYGAFPVLCPNGSNYSVKLGNDQSGSQAEGISYTYTIPANATNFSILYQYAVVFENPGHGAPEQPRFRASVLNLTDNDTINCVSFDFTASSNLPGFKVSDSSTDVLYKDWTPVSLDLSKYAGKTIRLEFVTADCTLGGHFGYAYVDVNSECDGSIVGSSICFGDTSVNLTAPYGFQSYDWYTDNSFTQLLGTGQILTLNPAPNVGTVYPLIVTPYPGFGCIDTVYATVKTAPKPPSFAGNDITTCRYSQWQLGATPNPANIYLWSPANLVTNSHIANPMGFITSFTPQQQFIVKTTNRATACFSYDTMLFKPIMIDTTLLLSGKTDYCLGQSFGTRLEIPNVSTGIQWLLNNQPIAGATSNIYFPTSTGTYRAKFIQLGCDDSTRSVKLTSHPFPQAGFTVNKDTQCVTNNSFVLKNLSSITGTDKLSYLWSFGDGTTSTVLSPVKNYTATATREIKLIVTSNQDCADTASRLVHIFPNVDLAFKWGTTCTNAPTLFTNLTNEHNSYSVNYLWDFGNTMTAAVKDPAAFFYTIGKTYTVSLKATAVGCETAPQTITQPVTIYEPMPAMRYRDITVPKDYNYQVFARASFDRTYRWVPSTQLNSTTIKAPSFYAAGDMKYLIYITDEHRCIITDTLQMITLNTKGYYLPNAFTPNSDGLNDVLRPYLVGMKSLRKFSIYNRVGNLIYSTQKDGEGWDGTYKGSKVDPATFVWVLEYNDVNNNAVMQKGTVLLIR